MKSALLGIAISVVAMALVWGIVVFVERQALRERQRQTKEDLKADEMFLSPKMIISSADLEGPGCVVEDGNFTSYTSPDGKYYASWPTPPPDAKPGSCCKLVVVPCEDNADHPAPTPQGDDPNPTPRKP